MKKILLFVLPMLFLSFAMKAQLSYALTADTAVINLPNNDTTYKAKLTITNTNPTDSVQFEWTILDYSVPGDWLGSNQGVCDWEQCNGFANTALHMPRKLAPNESQDMYCDLGRSANSSAGCSSVRIRFNEAGMAQNEVLLQHSSYADVATCFPLNTKDFSDEEIVTVYPNPATSYVNLTVNDSRVKSIQLSNIIGRQIKRVNVLDARSRAQQINLSGLPNGLYILQFKNATGKVMGVHRITKQ